MIADAIIIFVIIFTLPVLITLYETSSPAAVQTFSSGMLLGIFTFDFQRRQEIHDDVGSTPGSLQRYSMAAVVQQLHLTVLQLSL